MKRLTIILISALCIIGCKAQTVKHKTIVHHYRADTSINYGNVDDMYQDDNGQVVIWHDKFGNKIIDSIGFGKPKIKPKNSKSVIKNGRFYNSPIQMGNHNTQTNIIN